MGGLGKSIVMHPKLFEYGIQLERSDIRVHVSPSTKCFYVFPTAAAQALLDERGQDFKEVLAFQPGIEYPTARGRLVPHTAIPKLQVLRLPDCAWWANFKANDNTSRKGALAVRAVIWALRSGRLPLWVAAASETESVSLQHKGTDILLTHRWRIQVKCDWDAGPKESGGSGNLFLQNAEVNPRRRH